MLIHFGLPIAKLFKNIKVLHHIAEFFCGKYQDYKTLQNNFNCQKVSNFSCGIRYFSLHQSYKNSLSQLY